MITAAERAALRARHQRNTDLSPRPYCTNADDVHGDHREWAGYPCEVTRLLDALDAADGTPADYGELRALVNREAIVRVTATGRGPGAGFTWTGRLVTFTEGPAVLLDIGNARVQLPVTYRIEELHDSGAAYITRDRLAGALSVAEPKVCPACGSKHVEYERGLRFCATCGATGPIPDPDVQADAILAALHRLDSR